MLNGRVAVRLGRPQLKSVILGISHLIEQQYAQKLSDEQFDSLDEILGSVHKRGVASSIIPYYDSFRWCSNSYQFSTTQIGPGDKYELFPKDPAEILDSFVEFLLEQVEKVDKNGNPLIFLSLSDDKKKYIIHRINKVLEGNIPTSYEDELKQLIEKLQ